MNRNWSFKNKMKICLISCLTEFGKTIKWKIYTIKTQETNLHAIFDQSNKNWQDNKMENSDLTKIFNGYLNPLHVKTR